MFKKKDDAGGKKEKGFGSLMKNSMTGAIAQAKTGTKNTEQTLKIQLTQKKILDEKHKFGVAYMDLLLSGVEQEGEEIQACVESHLEEIQRLMGKLDKYQGIISTNKQKLELKLAKKAGKPVPHTDPTLQVTDSAASAESSGVDQESSTAEDNAALASASFPDTDSGFVAAASNPFDEDEDDDDDAKAKAAFSTAVEANVPLAEAIPVSDNNNPFDSDKEEEEKKPAPAKLAAAASVNPFEEDDDDEIAPAAPPKKSESVNPFGDDSDDEEDAKPPTKPPASAPTNPFDDADC